MVARFAPFVIFVVAVATLTFWFLRAAEHAQWKDREVLPSCGEVSLDQGERLRVDAPDDVDCLKEAMVSGEGAELVVTYPTVEGDPITDYYRVLPGGTTEIYTDATVDAATSAGWTYGECAEPASALDPVC